MLLGMLLGMHWAGQVSPSAMLQFLAALGHGVSQQLCWSSPKLCHHPPHLHMPTTSPKCSSSHQHSLDSGLLKLHVVSVCSLTPKRNCVPQPPCMSLLAPTTSSDIAFQHFSPEWRECVWKWHSLVSKQKFGEIGVFLAEIFSHGQCLQTKVFIL